jgi:hypothetical protein
MHQALARVRALFMLHYGSKEALTHNFGADPTPLNSATPGETGRAIWVQEPVPLS